jgi:hypothetical protein
MTWRDIIKVNTIADSQKAIDALGFQIETLKMIDEAIRKFANGEELSLIEVKNLAKSHDNRNKLIRDLMITLMEKVEGV